MKKIIQKLQIKVVFTSITLGSEDTYFQSRLKV